MKLALATPADAPRLTRLVNSAYRGEEARQGWTTETDLLDGQRIDEAGMRELLGAPQAAMLLCLGLMVRCWAASTPNLKARQCTSACWPWLPPAKPRAWANSC